MHLPDSALQMISYYRRNGFWATWWHAAVYLWRTVFQTERVLLCCDLQRAGVALSSSRLPGQLTIERLRSLDEIGEADWRKIESTRTPAICHRVFAERFKKGASLWLARCDGNPAGYGWTLSCGSVEGRYYPADGKDVHLFEFLVFPEYRGLRINSLLVNHITSQLATEGRVHAYLEVAQWNKSGLNSYRRTSFRPLGISKQGLLRRRRLVKWIDPEGVHPECSQQDVAVRTRPA